MIVVLMESVYNSFLEAADLYDESYSDRIILVKLVNLYLREQFLLK